MDPVYSKENGFVPVEKLISNCSGFKHDCFRATGSGGCVDVGSIPWFAIRQNDLLLTSITAKDQEYYQCLSHPVPGITKGASIVNLECALKRLYEEFFISFSFGLFLPSSGSQV